MNLPDISRSSAVIVKLAPLDGDPLVASGVATDGAKISDAAANVGHIVGKRVSDAVGDGFSVAEAVNVGGSVTVNVGGIVSVGVALAADGLSLAPGVRVGGDVLVSGAVGNSVGVCVAVIVGVVVTDGVMLAGRRVGVLVTIMMITTGVGVSVGRRAIPVRPLAVQISPEASVVKMHNCNNRHPRCPD